MADPKPNGRINTRWSPKPSGRINAKQSPKPSGRINTRRLPKPNDRLRLKASDRPDGRLRPKPSRSQTAEGKLPKPDGRTDAKALSGARWPNQRKVAETTPGQLPKPNKINISDGYRTASTPLPTPAVTKTSLQRGTMAITPQRPLLRFSRQQLREMVYKRVTKPSSGR